MNNRIGLIGSAVLVLLATSSPAQTNLVSFTNKNHEVISNAIVIRHDSVKLIYRTEGAGGGSVKLADLPEDLQKRFGYDPVQAAAAEERAQAAARREAIAAANAATERAGIARLEEIKSTGTIVWGKVIQRIGDRLLVSTGNETPLSGLAKQSHGLAIHHSAPRYSLPREWQDGVPKQWQEAYGTILLVDHPQVDSLVDGDMVLLIAYPAGTYEYTAVSGGRKTIRKFTASLAAAVLNDSR